MRKVVREIEGGRGKIGTRIVQGCALELYINTGAETLLLTVEANINKMTISKQSSVCDLCTMCRGLDISGLKEMFLFVIS